MIDKTNFPEKDSDWSEVNWESFLKYLVESKITTYKEIASALLSSLNPPQVGTGVASKQSFKDKYPKRKVMQAVMGWFYSQRGVCEDCGTRLELQADHVDPRQNYINADEADRLENLELRCRRCNVTKRPSHTKGGLTFLTAAAALMWILFTKRPTSLKQYSRMCREYGLTMASVRFQEAWAMAIWLNKSGEYVLDETDDLKFAWVDEEDSPSDVKIDPKDIPQGDSGQLGIEVKLEG